MANKLWDTKRRVVYGLLKEARNKAEMTQVELSVALDKPQSYVSKYETGERKLDLVEVADICDALNCDLVVFCKQYQKNV